LGQLHEKHGKELLVAIDVTIKIGGEAGQGIQTVGTLLASACQRAGLYVMGINDFESRIRGGHNFFQIRMSDRPVRAPHGRVNLLVGLDRVTADLYRTQVLPGGLIMVDSDQPDSPEGLLAIPISELAKKAGGEITANTVAAGVCLSLLGAPFDLFSAILQQQFSGKSEKIIEENLTAGQLGYQAVEKVKFTHAFQWKMQQSKGLLLSGDQAIALGALAGDCRFAAFYPMSPSTGINMHLSSLTDRFPLVVEQAEDEIAAITMVIGASYAGVRAMTATSGGGFCLMTEGLGLAGITETPVVIVNAQRPGPATGLPTRTGQGDLHFVIRASQDEFPRFVFAPGTPEEGFATARKAFHLAEKYQVPVIILVDQYFIDSLYITERECMVPNTVERFIAAKLNKEEAAQYKRYALSPTGVSPRALPCRSEALVVANGNEHREDGHITESIDDRNNMANKRSAKLPHMLAEMRSPEICHKDARSLLVGWGTTFGVIQEVVHLLRSEGVDVGQMHFTDLWPFPSDATLSTLQNGRQFFIIENNGTGQLGQLIRQETGLKETGNILKFDGRPFFVNELYERVRNAVR